MTDRTEARLTGTMMTLAGLTAIGAVERYATESLAAQQQRISAGIRAELARDDLWSHGWQLEWIGLTEDRANMVFIASNTQVPGQFAVCLRGTVFSIQLDVWEDAEVWSPRPFPYGGQVASGTWDAYTETVTATGAVDDASEAQGQTLLGALCRLLHGVDAPTLYVTGHSLGGALTTLVSPLLAATFPQASVLPYTFAAPTAGDADFAAAFNGQFPTAVCEWNAYDAVPHAWQDIPAILGFYPDKGPKPTDTEWLALEALRAVPWDNTYVQPRRQQPLNQDYHENTSGDFIAEVKYQHLSDTYLRLLTAPPINWPASPQIAQLNPWSGSGGDKVTITATDDTSFTSDCVVDFSRQPATNVDVANDGRTITVTAPTESLGAAYVYVTNVYGMSDGSRFWFD